MRPNTEASALDAAEAALAKLPILGPVVWLMARSEDRRYVMACDIETTILPSVVLDQCRIFFRGSLPLAFINWARVSDEVHQRLLGGTGRLAPHEWNGGPHLWIVDIIAPFGELEDLLGAIRRDSFPTEPMLRYLALDPTTRRAEVRVFAPTEPPPVVM